MHTLLIASQKGGVGKTTTAINLATLAAQSGQRVLLLDADPLGTVATSLQLSRSDRDGKPPQPDRVTRRGCVWTGIVHNLDVLSPYPADSTDEDHLNRFLRAIPNSPLPRSYDLIVIDAPAMLGPRQKALLKASQEVLIVQRAEPMSFRTLPAFLELIRQVKTEGSKIKLRGILMTLPSGVLPGSKSELRLREKFQGILPQVIPFDAEVTRALVMGTPIAVLQPNSAVTKQYRSLAAALSITKTIATAVVTKQPVLVTVGPVGNDHDTDEDVLFEVTSKVQEKVKRLPPTTVPKPLPRPAKIEEADDDECDVMRSPEPSASAGPKTIAGRTQTFYPNRVITTPGKGPNLLATLAVQKAALPPSEKVIPLWHLVLLCIATFFFTASAAWLFLG